MFLLLLLGCMLVESCGYFVESAREVRVENGKKNDKSLHC